MARTRDVEGAAREVVRLYARESLSDRKGPELRSAIERLCLMLPSHPDIDDFRSLINNRDACLARLRMAQP